MAGVRRLIAWSLAGLCLTLPAAVLVEARADAVEAACLAPYRTTRHQYRSELLHVAGCEAFDRLDRVI